MTTPDEAMLWARELMAQHYAKRGDPKSVTAIQDGLCDGVAFIPQLSAAYRACQSANAERVAVLAAENERLRALCDAHGVLHDTGRSGATNTVRP